MDSLKQIMQDAGILGAGGAGFPSYAKLAPGADLLVINGAECEPLLYTYYIILKRELPLVLEGIKAVLAAAHLENQAEGIVDLKPDLGDKLHGKTNT